MKEIAIIGPTASGKSDIALKIAKNLPSFILSLDSLSIYKEIDIVSAKPNKKELKEVKHFGIDEIYPNEYFSVDIFIDIYKKAKKEALNYNKNLIIVGGTSFYLKVLIDGISKIPNFKEETVFKVKDILRDLKSAYNLLEKIDSFTAKKIDQNDRYRIEKALLIYFETNIAPSLYFQNNPKKPVIKNIPIYEIYINRDKLKEKIKRRTMRMVEMGLVDEIAYLEKKYTRDLNPMKAIGIKETLEYLDGKLNIDKLIEKITINTYHLAKRQQTFNKTQFKEKKVIEKEKIKEVILKDIVS